MEVKYFSRIHFQISIFDFLNDGSCRKINPDAYNILDHRKT